MADNEQNVNRTASDDIAAAEAELKAAQQKLEDAKAKMEEIAAPAEPEVSVDSVTVADSATAAGPTTAAEPALVADPTTAAESSVDAVPATDTVSQQPMDPVSPQASGFDPANTYVAPQSAEGHTPPPPPPGVQQPYQPPVYGQQEGQYQQPPSQQPSSQQSQGYQQPYYGQQGYQQPAYTAPTSKDRVIAGVLAILLGSLGIHKFYLGYTRAGVIMLLVSLIGGIITLSLAAGVMAVIGIIEGIMYLTKSQPEFEQTYVLNTKEWF